MGAREEGRLGRGRGSALLLMLLAVVLFVGSIGIATVQRRDHRSRVDAELGRTAALQATVLDNYFERARSVALLLARNPSFAGFYEAPGGREEKIRAQGPPILGATEALAYLESLYRGSIGEACFIDLGGSENARVVRGEVAPIDDLSPDEASAPFFEPTFALDPDEVYQATPYVSPDTGEWVISNSTTVPSHDGSTSSIVHFEVTLESFRQAARRATADGMTIRVVDAGTGDVVIDSVDPAEADAPLPRADDTSLAWVTQTEHGKGFAPTHDGRAAYTHLQQGLGNANDWVVVTEQLADARALAGVGVGTLALMLAAILLFVVGLFGFRATQDELTRAALTDSLTGLRNRRQLFADLEAAFADGRDVALVMFDLDGFKGYNDAFGHPAGDALLERLAHRLQDVAGTQGAAYRLGGDEFCLLIDPGTPREPLVATALDALTERGEGFAVTASHGFVEHADAADADEMLHLADKRMYVEKHGRHLTADTQSRDVLLRVLEERYPELLADRDELASLAEGVARRLELTESDVLLARRAAELHDVGKVAIPDSILRKPEPLTDEEWVYMRQHSEVGQRILDVAPGLASVGRLIRAHHERFDGTGYPDGLAGDEIPLGARIVAVVDAWHAMRLEDRPHRQPLSHVEAVAELRRHAGTQFDPAVVEAFVDLVVGDVAALDR
jgi:diguanylate cyclase (GGDEF)-like protein